MGGKRAFSNSNSILEFGSSSRPNLKPMSDGPGRGGMGGLVNGLGPKSMWVRKDEIWGPRCGESF